MEGIHKLASQIDIGLTLAEVTDEVLKHKIEVNEEDSTINVYCMPNKSLKNIQFSLQLSKSDKSSK
jgi:hypothetical protein